MSHNEKVSLWCFLYGFAMQFFFFKQEICMLVYIHTKYDYAFSMHELGWNFDSVVSIFGVWTYDLTLFTRIY